MNTDLIPRYRILRRLQINYRRASTDATVFNSSIIQLDSQFYSQFSWQPQGGMSFERPLCPGGGLPSSVYDSVEPISDSESGTDVSTWMYFILLRSSYVLDTQSCDRSYYKAATQIFGNTIHHCRIFCLWYPLPFTKQVGYLLSNKLFSEDYLWFALSFNGIRPWQPWSCYAVCFSHSLFARPADQNASFVMAVLTPTFHAIQIRLRVFVALQNGPAYRIVYVLLPRSHAMLGISILLADPALIVSGFLSSAHISALNRVSGWPAKWINCCTRA